MTSLELFEKMDCLNDKYILDAEVSPVYSQVVTKKHTARDFWESPWVVAALCACVSLFVLGGIIWAGNSSTPPISAGTQAEETEISPEIEQTSPPQEYVTEPVTQTEEITTQAETEEDIPAPEYETNEDGLYILMTEPYIWESTSPSASQLIEQIDVELPEGVTMRRTAVYHRAWVGTGEQDLYIVEVRELTDLNGNRSIHLITRDPYNIEEELHTYSVDIGNNSHWGLVQASSEFFLYYIKDYRRFDFAVQMYQLYLGNIGATSGARLDSMAIRILIQHWDMNLLYPSASTKPSSHIGRRKLWNSTIQDSYQRTSSTFRMIADDFFGESTFFEEDDITTIGWERLQKFLYCQFREDIAPPPQEDIPNTPDAPPVDPSDNTEEQTMPDIEPIT